MRTGKRLSSLWALAILALLVTVACTPPAAPTATPTKAPATTAAAPQAQAPTPGAKAGSTTPAGTTTPVASKPSGPAIKIGFLVPLSGPMAGNGAPHKYGPIIAAEDINASGGINGSPVEIVMYDSPFDPRQAVNMVRKLAQEDKVVAILGPYASSEFEVAAPLANDLKIPVISTTATKPGIAEANRPWSFRFGLTDDRNLPPAVAVFKKRYPNVKKVVIVGDTKAAATEPIVKELYSKLLKDAGFEVGGTIPFDTGTTDFGAIVTKIKELNPDGLAVSALTPEALLLAKEIYRQGIKVPAVISGHVFAGAAFAVQGKEAVEGWVVAGYADEEDPNPRMKTFVARFKQLAGEDSQVPKPVFTTNEPQAYDAMMAVAETLRKGKVTASTPLQDARNVVKDGLQSLKDYPGLVGTLTVLPSGDVSWNAVPFVAQNGWWKSTR